MRRVTFPTTSPHALLDVLRPRVRRRVVDGVGYLYEPPGPTAPNRLPGVVVLQDLGGLKAGRELAYGEQLARRGHVALVVDSVGPRGAEPLHPARRPVAVTEAMMLADAFAALRFLAEHPRVDPRRVAVMGFAFGGMVGVLAAYRQIHELFVMDDLRFAAHVSFYGWSAPRLAQPETTGAPVLMLLGELDESVSVRRSRDIAADLRRGGSAVTVKVYPETFHGWDGDKADHRHATPGFGRLRLTVTEDQRILHAPTRIEMRGPLTRRLILALSACRMGYGIQRNPQAKASSDADLARFLADGIGEPEILARPGASVHRLHTRRRV